MKFKIERQDKDVIVRFEHLGGQVQEVIEAIGRCRQSAWACTSGECMKIASMDTSADGDVLSVRLRPRSDAEFSVASLDECLQYQLPKEINK